jgi:hypothetical protein
MQGRPPLAKVKGRQADTPGDPTGGVTTGDTQ